MDDCITISDDEDVGVTNRQPAIIDLTKSPHIETQKNAITLSDSDSDTQMCTPPNIRHTSAIQTRKKNHSRSKVTKSSAQQAPAQPPTPSAISLKCPICIETYVDIKQRGLKVVITRCGHLFCDFCLKKSLSENGRHCPKCRKNVPKGPTAMIQVYDI